MKKSDRCNVPDESSGLMPGGKLFHRMRRKSVYIGIKYYKLTQNMLIHLQQHLCSCPSSSCSSWTGILQLWAGVKKTVTLAKPLDCKKFYSPIKTVKDEPGPDYPIDSVLL